jgi:hypothetical protein
VTRSFSSFSEAADENARSRLLGGIHWSFDNVDGLEAGRALGEYVASHFLLPRDNPISLESGCARSTDGGITYAPHGLFDGDAASGIVNLTDPGDRASGGIDDQGDTSTIPVDSSVTGTGDGFGASAVGGGVTITPGGAVYADLLADITADFALTDPDDLGSADR